MKRFTQQNLPFPDPRSAKELATAIWNYELLPAHDFTNVKGEHIHCKAKTFASVALDTGSQAVKQFRHALFDLSNKDNKDFDMFLRRSIETALPALEDIAKTYDQLAKTFRINAEVEFIDTPKGPVARHTAEMIADINEAENHEMIARKLREDPELRKLVQALANKLQVDLRRTDRTL